MKLISHRGNISGPKPSQENNPEYIDDAIDAGFDVEIDLRYHISTQSLWLGHDKLQYKIDLLWLVKRNKQLWIHCKNIDTLDYMSNSTNEFNYFWHENDTYTLTSKKIIWSNVNTPSTLNSVVLMPEWSDSDFSKLKFKNCYGICSDYISKLK